MAAKKKTDEERVAGSEHWQEFRSIAYVRATQLPNGKYLVHGSLGDVWEIDEADFYARYKPVTPNKS